jgi:two-component system NarL family sensor kinase
VEPDDRLCDELSRVNNELLNAQRELVQKNVQLERAEEELRQTHRGLEQKVDLRTRELEVALSAFQEEVRVRRTTEEKLRALSLSVLHLQDEERRRVARDLHDTAGQTLTALKLILGSLERAVSHQGPTAELFAELSGLADQALGEIRTTSHLLHPPLLDEAGFASAASWYVDGFNKRSAIEVSLHLPEGIRLPNAVEIVLFRILQESLTNITKHSAATAVDVSLEVSEDAVILSVRDYGRGILPERLARMNTTGSEVGVGIAGMRERLKELGGRLEIESDTSGTLLRATIPCWGTDATLRKRESKDLQKLEVAQALLPD